MRITSDGPGNRLGASILPVPARLGQGYQSWGPVNGNPGIDPIPAPYPAAVPQGIRYANAGDATQFSDQAPALWRPGVYYQPTLSSRFGGALVSDNQMPVPAQAPNAKGFVAMKRPNLLGQRQVGQPFVTPTYPWGN